MVNFLSSWAKSLTLAIIIVSILEMMLPNNKTKKYVKMIMGVYILFNIISPFIKNVQAFDVNNINVEKYVNNTTSENIVINQDSMDQRIQDLYIQEIQKDVKSKIEEKGYIVNKCKVDAVISGKEGVSGIKKIVLKIEKDNKKKEEIERNEDTENKIVTEIQKIKKIDAQIKNDNSKEEEKISSQDIKNLKDFLKQEYEVSEKCLEIN